MDRERGTFFGAIVFGLVCLTVGLLLLRVVIRRYQEGIPAAGVVIEAKARFGEGGKTVTDYVVEWTDAEGRVRKFSRTVEGNDIAVGQKIRFRYDPKRPDDGPMPTSGWIFVAVPLLMLGFMGFHFAYQVRRRVLREDAVR